MPGICAGAYSVTRTWTANDACGNISSASQTINVQDISAPVIASLPAPTTIDCPATPEFATATATDECGSAFTLTYEDSTVPGICAGAYSVTRTWTATDACGNISSASQTINVRDITAPVVVCPGNITVNNDPGDCGANVIVPTPTVLETCGVVSILNDLNLTSNANGYYPVGTTQIIWTISDECNNVSTCTMSVTVTDNEAPAIQCPEDVLICSTETLNIGLATGTDNCGILSVTNNATGNFMVGTTAITWTVTDIHGNSSSCEQSITIVPMVTANAGPDETICQNSQGYQVLGATASNYSSLLWTTTGNGSLLNANTISPTYVPQTGETGNVYLTLTASGIAPCSGTSDQLLLSIIPGPMVSAGDDATICENQVFVPTTSNAAYYNSILWTTSGTGTFNDPTILHPTYTPGATDIQSGTVVLTLTSIGSALCGNIADNMTLTISEAIIAQAGPDEATCQGIPFTVNQASAQNAVSVYWTHNGLGTLTGNTTLNPTYTPAQNELGTILLTLHAEGLGTCGNNEDQMALSVHGIPQVFAGNDNSSCGNNPFVLSEATSSNIESHQWTTSGDGIFDVPTLLNATYLPGPNDLDNGVVTLKLTAIGYANCGIVKDSLVLTLTTEPSANAGPDASTCSSSPYTIQYANATSVAGLYWTHNGNGTLNDATTLHPTYIPGINETGNVTLVLHITAYGNCGSVLDSMSLMVQEPALADAGNDLATCDQASVRITNSQASAYTSILWVSSGDGSFDDPTDLHPLYTPGNTDRANGLVRLSLHLQGITPCQDVVDEMLLQIGMSPKVYAGDDAYLCQNESFTIIGATAISQGTISWQISPASSGVLSGANTLTPTFTPASGYFGEVILTLSQEGSSACANIVATDQVKLTVNKSPVANAGEDQVIGEDKRAKLNGSASEGSGLYAWKWQPEKFLEDATSMNPMTLPLGSTTTFTLTVMDLVSSCSGNDEITVFIGSPGFEIIARADYDTVLVNNSGKIEVLLNDIYPDNSKVTLSLCSNPNNGLAIINPDQTITYQPKRKFTGDDSLCYRICIDVTPEVCVDTMVYIHVRPTKIDDLLVVSGITPNDDNVNDDWTIRGIEDYPDNTVIIFNRWGDKIRSFSGYDNKEKVWDGKNEEGKPVPDGTYFYILEIKELGKSSGWIFVRGNRE
ncbi:MAG: gliding motility-associated C-terminal domain-containing protein [Bacteroidales bacterium]|nr:gliding motility-associated C-terminal domain-containing protein [Bacteroidales bacterium]